MLGRRTPAMREEYNRLADELDEARKAARKHLETGVATFRDFSEAKMAERVVDEEWLVEHKALRAAADAAEDRFLAYLQRLRR
jgi:hypothetical protein